MRGVAGVAGEEAAVCNYNDEVIPLSPTLLVCYVWLLQTVIRCVLPSARNKLGKRKNTTS
jgi:hypothetical protein